LSKIILLGSTPPADVGTPLLNALHPGPHNYYHPDLNLWHPGELSRLDIALQKLRNGRRQANIRIEKLEVAISILEELVARLSATVLLRCDPAPDVDPLIFVARRCNGRGAVSKGTNIGTATAAKKASTTPKRRVVGYLARRVPDKTF
jgi:hypothetical protein